MIKNYRCDGCDDTFNSKVGLKFESTIVRRNPYIWCASCQQDNIPTVQVERHDTVRNDSANEDAQEDAYWDSFQMG
jgi:hypothetical protein